MYYNVNMYYDVDIQNEFICILNKKTGEKTRYKESQICKMYYHMSPNQLYFNGMDCSLIRYIRTYLLPYDRQMEYYKEIEKYNLAQNTKNSFQQRNYSF